MFRADSPLTVIFISDENDICARYPNDIVRVNDPDGEELPAFIRDCENITPAGVHAQFKNLKGTQPLIVSAIVYTDPATTPAGGENEVGYGYTDIVNINGGVLVDMAENNISGGMGGIGGQSAFQIGFLASFGLCGPSSDLNVSSLIVQVDGQNAPFTYDPDTNIVHLDNPGDVGDVVTINYCPNVIADGLGDGTGPDSQ